MAVIHCLASSADAALILNLARCEERSGFDLPRSLVAVSFKCRSIERPVLIRDVCVTSETIFKSISVRGSLVDSLGVYVRVVLLSSK